MHKDNRQPAPATTVVAWQTDDDGYGEWVSSPVPPHGKSAWEIALEALR